MKQIPSYLSLLLLLFCCMACSRHNDVVNSNKVQQENIFQFYQATYRSETQTLDMLAAFTVDNKVGQAIQLVEPADITFNGTAMEWNPEGFYSMKLSNFTKELLFQYVNNDHTPFVNRLSINSLLIKSANLKFKKDQQNVVSFQGDPLSENESIVCLLSKNDSDSFEINADAEGRRIVIPATYLTEVPAGKYEGYFIRKNSSATTQSMDRGGLWETEYFSKKIQITIE